MTLGRKSGSQSGVRDVEADFLAAQIAEYESYANAGTTEHAEAVAAELRKKGHEVRPKRPVNGQKERAVDDGQLERAVEGDAPPKRPGRAKKPTE